jgi:hypothetical protein
MRRIGPIRVAVRERPLLAQTRPLLIAMTSAAMVATVAQKEAPLRSSYYLVVQDMVAPFASHHI